MTHPKGRRPYGTPPPSVPLSPKRTVRAAKTGGGGGNKGGGRRSGGLAGCALILVIPAGLLLSLALAGSEVT